MPAATLIVSPGAASPIAVITLAHGEAGLVPHGAAAAPCGATYQVAPASAAALAVPAADTTAAIVSPVAAVQASARDLRRGFMDNSLSVLDRPAHRSSPILPPGPAQSQAHGPDVTPTLPRRDAVWIW